jgi:hypothetical protein
LADEASRVLDLNEEILNPNCLTWLETQLIKKPNIDGCATFANKKYKKYISRFKETENHWTNFLTYSPEKNDVLYLFPPKNAQNFMAKKLFTKYENLPFVAIFHTFEKTPFFLPFKPKKSRLINLSNKFDNPTLTPSKNKSENWGFFGPNKSSPKTYAIINLL